MQKDSGPQNVPSAYQHIETTSPDVLQQLTPEGWDQQFYLLDNSSFDFRRRTFQLNEHIFIQDTFIEKGRIRIDGHIRAGRLQIGFYESEAYRFLGRPGDIFGDILLGVSYDNSRWETVASAPARGVSINFDEYATSQLMEEELRARLKNKMVRGAEHHAIIAPMPLSGMPLRNMLLELLDHAAESPPQEGWAHVVEDKINPAFRKILHKFTAIGSQANSLGEKQRHNLAVDVERILWRFNAEELANEITLDYLAATLNISRRNIQASIMEQFGVGFVELKRVIRLQQFRETLIKSGQSLAIGVLAEKHGFSHFGRFAGYYKDFYGETPSQTLQVTKAARDDCRE